MNAITRHWDVAKDALKAEKARVNVVRRVSDTDFLPAALEIVERPVSPTGRATAWVLMALLALTIIWLVFGKIDVIASAPGKLVPADNVKLVQPAEAGIVRAILVRNGQRVTKGQPLVELDPTISGAELAQAQKGLETAELDAARNRAILSGLDGRGVAFTPPPGTPANIASTQAQLAQAQVAEILAGISALAADTRAASSTRDASATQAAKLTETIPLIDEQLAANEALLEKGYVSKLRVIEMRRQRLSLLRDRDIALQNTTRAGAEMASAGSGAVRNRAEARARILADLARAESEAKLRREELTKTLRRSSLQRLVAPVDGTIAQLQVFTVGGVVEAAKPVMVVVPAGGNVVVEARLLGKDAGFVRAGYPVSVKLDAFPFNRHGTIPGVVENVGSDSIEDEKMGLVYPVRVRLNCAAAKNTALCDRIMPGMSGVADIRTGSRSIGSYLVSPIDQARLEAGRER